MFPLTVNDYVYNTWSTRVNASNYIGSITFLNECHKGLVSIVTHLLFQCYYLWSRFLVKSFHLDRLWSFIFPMHVANENVV